MYVNPIFRDYLINRIQTSLICIQICTGDEKSIWKHPKLHFSCVWGTELLDAPTEESNQAIPIDETQEDKSSLGAANF